MSNLGNLINLEKDLEKIAIIDEDGLVTYRQLHNMSNFVAQSLFDQGFRSGDRIAIKGLNNIDYVAAYLGILKLGAVAVLVNVKLPQEQIDYVIKDSGSKFLWVAPGVPKTATAEFEVCNVHETDPAIIMYTSGSTSAPKGVVLPHKHKWIIEQKSKLPRAEQRRAIVAAPLYHMNGLSNTEAVICSHATLVLLEKFDSKKFLTKIAEHRVNSITSVPTMLSMLLQEQELISTLDLSSVRHIGMASSPVSKSLWQGLKTTFPGAVLINAYGITEVSPGMFGPHPSLPTPDMSVGYPTPGIEYRIVDGILQVKSPSMFLKYNNVTLNNVTEDGFFITNDLFKVDDNGFYYFLGRADDMFVSGGNNIYPRQIESILEDHPLVKNAAVIGLDDEVKGSKPYAFIQGTASESELLAYVKTKLPPSHYPRKIWNLEELPLNSVNKVDKQKLKGVALSKLNTPCTVQN
jgi:acyl-CoA synthetase (AMP-forming)/AMP-acid ligase II